MKVHAHIMQIVVPSVSVITKLCGGFDGGILSVVKSCGQSRKQHKATFVFVCLCGGDPLLSA